MPSGASGTFSAFGVTWTLPDQSLRQAPFVERTLSS